ncbi:hypothetical protein [uncultured Paracoccus sp.]|uniref:hypothetical protein n=1 Tax=uncultured Paracoccus sp. TaxID=189685 RepID=UPI0025F831E4|nr:hypothetical protein [uncultured Paracoccus sp.]
MLQTLSQMTFARATPVAPRTWAAIPDYLKGKIAAGASKSSAAKIKSAVNGLLKVKGMTAENALLTLKWFDEKFPADGWNPATMSFDQVTYQDYRHRVRPVIVEILSVGGAKKALPITVDEWEGAATEFETLEAIAGPHSRKKLIPLRNTLTTAARRARLRPADLDQRVLMDLYDDAKKSERLSLRTVSRMISMGQKASPAIARRFPHPIHPIEADGAFRYAVPEHLAAEIEHFVERAARKKYIRVKKIHDYVKPGTRTGMRTTMRAVVDGFIATGHLD